MVKTILIVAAVVIIDSLIRVLGPDSDSPVDAHNLTSDNVSTREMTFGRATPEQIRRARFSLLGVLLVTSIGAVIVVQQIQRHRIDTTLHV